MEVERIFGHAPNDFTTIAQAQKDFYIAIYTLPHLHSAYRNMAELWRRFGNDEMAVRLLTSVLHAKPDPLTEQQRAVHCRGCASPRSRRHRPNGPGPARSPRILILTHDYSDYGMDNAITTACARSLATNTLPSSLGRPTLHGERTDEAANYPCVFDYPGRAETGRVSGKGA